MPCLCCKFDTLALIKGIQRGLIRCVAKPCPISMYSTLSNLTSSFLPSIWGKPESSVLATGVGVAVDYATTCGNTDSHAGCYGQLHAAGLFDRSIASLLRVCDHVPPVHLAVLDEIDRALDADPELVAPTRCLIGHIAPKQVAVPDSLYEALDVTNDLTSGALPISTEGPTPTPPETPTAPPTPGLPSPPSESLSPTISSPNVPAPVPSGVSTSQPPPESAAAAVALSAAVAVGATASASLLQAVVALQTAVWVLADRRVATARRLLEVCAAKCMAVEDDERLTADALVEGVMSASTAPPAAVARMRVLVRASAQAQCVCSVALALLGYATNGVHRLVKAGLVGLPERASQRPRSEPRLSVGDGLRTIYAADPLTRSMATAALRACLAVVARGGSVDLRSGSESIRLDFAALRAAYRSIAAPVEPVLHAGAGKCLIATRRIAAGSCIISERPLMPMQPSSVERRRKRDAEEAAGGGSESSKTTVNANDTVCGFCHKTIQLPPTIEPDQASDNGDSSSGDDYDDHGDDAVSRGTLQRGGREILDDDSPLSPVAGHIAGAAAPSPQRSGALRGGDGDGGGPLAGPAAADADAHGESRGMDRPAAVAAPTPSSPSTGVAAVAAAPIAAPRMALRRRRVGRTTRTAPAAVPTGVAVIDPAADTSSSTVAATARGRGSTSGTARSAASSTHARPIHCANATGNGCTHVYCSEHCRSASDDMAGHWLVCGGDTDGVWGRSSFNGPGGDYALMVVGIYGRIVREVERGEFEWGDTSTVNLPEEKPTTAAHAGSGHGGLGQIGALTAPTSPGVPHAPAAQAALDDASEMFHPLTPRTGLGDDGRGRASTTAPHTRPWTKTEAMLERLARPLAHPVDRITGLRKERASADGCTLLDILLPPVAHDDHRQDFDTIRLHLERTKGVTRALQGSYWFTWEGFLSLSHLIQVNAVTGGLWYLCSFFNHACEPNAGFDVGDGSLNVLQVVALRDIQPGEEVSSASNP